MLESSGAGWDPEIDIDWEEPLPWWSDPDLTGSDFDFGHPLTLAEYKGIMADPNREVSWYEFEAIMRDLNSSRQSEFGGGGAKDFVSAAVGLADLAVANKENLPAALKWMFKWIGRPLTVLDVMNTPHARVRRKPRWGDRRNESGAVRVWLPEMGSPSGPPCLGCTGASGNLPLYRRTRVGQWHLIHEGKILYVREGKILHDLVRP